MQIKLAKSAGFCPGVKRAIELAEKQEGNQNTFTLGDIIHNEFVINKLKNKGINSEENIGKIPENSTVIIRSHGVGKEVIDDLKSKNINIVDATCPYVGKIHNIVKENYEKGVKIIIIGEKNHPEVKGTNGWCDYNADVIETIEDIPQFTDDEYCVVVQTTFDYKTYKQIIEIIKNRIKLIAINETICYTTKVRQDEALLLSQEVDIMIVIGSKKSANTRKLYDICKKNCERSYLITKESELSSVKFKINDIVGVTAGASTPNELMTEVINRMGNQQDMANNVSANSDIKPETAVTETNNNNVEASKPAGEKKPLTMEDVMKSTKIVRIKKGKKLKCKIIRVCEEGLYVNIDQAKDGFIAAENVSVDEYNPADYNIDDIIEAKIIEGSTKEYYCLSKKIIDIQKKEDAEVEAILKSDEFSLACNEVVKGGLVGKKGSYTIFVPASELRIGYVADLEQYKGKNLRLRAIPEKEKTDGGKKRRSNPKRIVASQRVILAEEKQAREEHFWAQMIPGNIVEGKVKRFAPFGVFVQVMGFDCLVHISDVSWVKIDDPSKVLEVNKSYDFEILKADREKGRVSLSYKSLQKTPYEIAQSKYPVGTVVKGIVDRIATFGAFIKIEDGIDGLVHVSQISHDWIKDASNALKVGEEVEAKVIKFEDNKITLSIKELLPEVVDEAKEEKAKARAKRKEERANEHREWVVQDEGVTIGDLFAGLKDIVPED